MYRFLLILIVAGVFSLLIKKYFFVKPNTTKELLDNADVSIEIYKERLQKALKECDLQISEAALAELDKEQILAKLKRFENLKKSKGETDARTGSS